MWKRTLNTVRTNLRKKSGSDKEYKVIQAAEEVEGEGFSDHIFEIGKY